MSVAKTNIYPHGDMKALESFSRKRGGTAQLIITDGVFSMEEMAPTRDYRRQTNGAMTVVDESHAIGFWGRGSEAYNISSKIRWISALGKALGEAVRRSSTI
jgi:8-amino-7-oxononanoate synthase